MPVDRKGRELRVGDSVIIPARVARIDPIDEFLNLVVETDEPIFPASHRTPIVLNTRQVEAVFPTAVTDQAKKDSDPCGNDTAILKRSNTPIQ